MSRNRDRTYYSFKRHRDALYAILEAAVTGGKAQEDDDVDVNSSGGNPSTVRRSRESNDSGQSSGETNKTYPSDFLWYEEMTPGDIDAYHAAHRGTPSSGGGVPTADPPPLDHRGTPSTSTLSRRDLRPGEQGCLEASDRYGNFAAGGDGEFVVANKAQVSPSFSSLLATPLRPTHHASGTGKGKASDPEFSSQLAVVSSSEMAQTPFIYSSSTSNDLPTAVECEVPGITTATTSVEDGSLAEPSKRRRPSPQQEDPNPFDRATGQQDQGAVAEAVATAATAAATTTATAATALPITGSQAHNVGRRRWLEAGEKSRPATTASTTTAAAATMTLTASEQSQATQSMFLPGLPSQLLVTQQQGDGGWDDVADGDLQEEEEDRGGEEEMVASEYALSLPVPHDDSIDEVSTGGIPELVPDPRRGFEGGHASSLRDAGSTELLLPGGGGGGGTRMGEDFGPETRACQNEGFTCVLRKFAGRTERERRGVATGSVESVRRGDGSGGHARQRLVLVPTQEVLPRGWVSGQAGVVGVLEDHLLRARQRFSDGYTIRALELACQVFRQTSVCVRTGGSGEDNIGQGVVAVARQMDSSGDAVASTADHAEVVGVTGLVWEILRVEIANQRCAGLI